MEGCKHFDLVRAETGFVGNANYRKVCQPKLVQDFVVIVADTYEFNTCTPSIFRFVLRTFKTSSKTIVTELI